MALSASALTSAVKSNLENRKVAPKGVIGFNDDGSPKTGDLAAPKSAPNGEQDLIGAICEEVVKHIAANLEMAHSLTFLPVANPITGIDKFSVTSAPLTGVGGGVPGPVSIPVVSISALTGSMTVTVPKGKFK